MSRPSPNFVEYTEDPVTTDDFIKPRPRLASLPSTPNLSNAGGFFIADERDRPFVENQTNRLPSRQKAAWVTVFICFLIGLFILGISVPTIQNYQALHASGLTVTGTVTSRDIHVSHSKNGTTTTYSISYQFTGKAANGEPKTYSGSQGVYSGTFYHYTVGGAIPILYLPSDQTINMIASDSNNNDSSVILAGLGLVMTVGCLWGLLAMWRRMVKWAQLGRDGKMITGTLTQVEGHWVSGKGAHYQLRLAYRFTDADNNIYDKTASLTRNDLHYKTLPAPGTSVYVLFLNSNNFHLM